MKKLVAGLLTAIGFSLLAGCSNESLSENAPVMNSNRGSVVVTVGNGGRMLNASDISTATVRVYESKNSFIEKTGISVKNGAGTVSIKGVPVGNNRVIEVVGYKADGIEGKRLYHAMNINAGVNNAGTIVDGADSAKGKAYLSLLKSDVNVSSVSLSGFVAGKSSYYFDAEGFAAAYKISSSAKVSDYYNEGATVNFTNLNKAGGYEIYIADPLSSKIVVSSNSDTTASIAGVAQGTWGVYVNSGSGAVKAGVVTVSGNSASYTNLIGEKKDPFAGKIVILVKAASAPTIWCWEPAGVDISEQQGYVWDTQPKMTAVPSDYMNDASGWYMYDVTGKATGKQISFILNKGSTLTDSKCTKTFWYDGKAYYNEDPTVPFVDTDVTLTEICVNGNSLGGSETSYTIGKNVASATVTATAKSSSAVVTVSDGGTASISQGSSKAFTITVTNNGNSAEYTFTVSRASATDTTLSSITVNGKSAAISGNSASITLKGEDSSLAVTSIVATAQDSDAVIQYSATTGTVADGKSKQFTITVSNGGKSAAYTLTVSYVMQEASQYYWTNKNGYGSYKTISSWEDWTSAEQIAQCAAYDDPRTWKGHQETAYDVYALYAAYDDTNLYIMVELVNLPDGRATFMNHDYAGSDNAWWNNRDCPLGFILNTGKGTAATSPNVSASGVIWGAINFSDSEGFDWLFYASSKFGTFEGKHVGVGTPGLFHAGSDGYFSYDADLCLSVGTTANPSLGTSGMTVQYQRQCAVSKTIYFESTPTDNRGTSGQTGESLLASSTYTACETNNLDMSYWYTVPLSTLGITKAYIQSNGIGIRQITPNGGSLMDCCPWDPCMVDVATEPCSDDPDTSHEKEDVDAITTPQARIGR